MHPPHTPTTYSHPPPPTHKATVEKADDQSTEKLKQCLQKNYEAQVIIFIACIIMCTCS